MNDPKAPQQQAAHQAELEVAAACLFLAERETTLIPGLQNLCRPADFVDVRSRAIYSAALSLHGAGTMLTPVTIGAEMERVGWRENALLDALHELAGVCSNVVEVAYASASVVHQAALQRREQQLLARLPKLVLEGATARRAITAELAEVQREQEEGGKPRILFPSAAEEIYELWSKPQVPAVHTGFAHLDRLLMGGLVPGRPSVLIASTGRGKSSLGIQICRHVMQSMPVLYMTRDMPKRDIYARFLAQERRESWRSISLMDPGSAAYLAAEGERNLHRLTVVETNPELAAAELVRAFVAARRCVPFIAVDTLQDLANDSVMQRGGNIFDAIGTTSTALKHIASEHGTVIFVLSHDSRGFKRKGRLDARAYEDAGFGSGSIERDVNALFYLETDPCPQDGSSKARLHVAKQTGGPAGVTMGLTYHGSIGWFSERAETDLDQDKKGKGKDPEQEAEEAEAAADLPDRITALLGENPGGLNTNKIKLELGYSDVRPVTRALEELEKDERVKMDPGPRNSKIWRLKGPQQDLQL